MTAFLPLAQAEWGTVPDWLEAFGTLAAFAVALRLLAKELAARREYQDDRRREQARLVSAWLDAAIEPSNVPFGPLEYFICLRNSSEEPIHDVKVTLVAENSSFASDPESVRTEVGGFREPGPLTLDRSVLPPAQLVKEPVEPEFLPTARGLPPLGLSFTDNQGRRWKRLPGGILKEATKRRRRSRGCPGSRRS